MRNSEKQGIWSCILRLAWIVVSTREPVIFGEIHAEKRVRVRFSYDMKPHALHNSNPNPNTTRIRLAKKPKEIVRLGVAIVRLGVAR